MDEGNGDDTGARTGVDTQQGAGAEQQPDWRAQIGDLANDPAVSSYRNLEDLVRSHVHAQRMIGVPPERVLKLPAGDEGWDEVYAKLGRPEDPAAYKFSDAGENVKIDQQYMDAYRKAAHEAGLSNKQADALFQWNNKFAAEYLSRQQAEGQARAQAALEEFKSTVGPDFEAAIELARKTVDGLGLSDVVDLNNSKALEAFYKIGKELDEAEIVDGSSSGFKMSAQDAKAEIDRMLHYDEQFRKAYFGTDDPVAHQEAVRKIADLQRIASGG